ncbi:hypothetical protein JJB07_02740 [Tumebacillus sp. ITR2]|uniref:Uncharacterized protein n=1 Tax=Tumebacillus amylolyticus TaxID=2801339 RepID=A0ABS1J5M6_9BACL|nr:hypothetical protein [Tumebacillus amylolyticus]MBL0385556.1 hypothetical protein [Tumebacillus amylolyticus]
MKKMLLAVVAFCFAWSFTSNTINLSNAAAVEDPGPLRVSKLAAVEDPGPLFISKPMSFFEDPGPMGITRNA